ncbi:MAG: fasciclin domain-containing protein [Neomegalonema sp.]|nr:fasciclin domain-containing protein [Neomegalonema sp.]
MAFASSAAQAKDIVDIAAGDKRFTTLVAAVKAAGLVDTLKGKGPFTVFAPTNDAFAALPKGTVEALLKPENKGKLTDILLYHVDDRLLLSKHLPERTIVLRPIKKAFKLCVTRSGKSVTIGDSTPKAAMVVIADIHASNGVIHVVDKVLLPSAVRCKH